MPRSLLDGVDLDRLRAASQRRGGFGATLVACLLEGGVFGHDPSDPSWPDRDHLVVGSSGLRATLARGLADAGDPAGSALLSVADGRALPVAAGIAGVTWAEGAVRRTFCLLDSFAVDDGGLWEGALAGAHTGGLVATLLVVPTVALRVRGLLDAAGWRCASAAADDPIEVLGAFDVALDDSDRAGAVVAVRR